MGLLNGKEIVLGTCYYLRNTGLKDCGKKI